MKKMNKIAFWPAIILLGMFIAAGIIRKEEVGALMTSLLYGMADYFGSYICLLAMLSLILAVIFLVSRYGNIVIGGKDAKPEYSMANWCAMSICSGIGTGLLFWAIAEPIYHYMSTPAAIGEAGTRMSGIFAVAQAMWDWSFVQYSMNAICGAVFAIICYNYKKNLSFNTLVETVTGRKIPWLNTLVTAVVIFCLMGVTSSSMSLGLMQIGAGLEAALGVSQSPIIWLIIAIAVTAIFVLSCVSGIGKGLKKLSSLCMYFFIFLLAYVLIFGNTKFIGKIGVEAVGFLVDHMGTMTTMSNVMVENETWSADWIIQTFSGFLTYAPVVGMFLARMAKGRTVRTFMLVQILVPSIFCMIWIAIFGGQTIYLQTSGTMDVWSAVGSLGMQATVFQILHTLPLAKIIIVLFLITIILSFCTLADPMSSVAATLSVDNLSIEDEAPKTQKILVGCILGGTAYTLVATGGIDSVKGMFTLVGLLQSIIFIMCIIALFRVGKQSVQGKQPDCMENREQGCE